MTFARCALALIAALLVTPALAQVDTVLLNGKIVTLDSAGTVEALAVVRILKPRIGMGIEFIDVERPYAEVLCRWIEQVRQSR